MQRKMSNVTLLDNTRKLNAILHKQNNGKVVFNDICAAMSGALSANVCVFSKKGKLLGVGTSRHIQPIDGIRDLKVGDFADRRFNIRMGDVLSTKENVYLETLGFTEEDSRKYQGIITPIDIAGERLGTLFIYKYSMSLQDENIDPRYKESFGIDDIIMCEYGATVVGLEMLRSVSFESAEEERKLHNVRTALGALSSTEIEALNFVFAELSGCEGVLVASRVADKAGITRSVIVNALRKLESAEIIESRSAGMKGTFIKVINPLIFDELDEIG